MKFVTIQFDIKPYVPVLLLAAILSIAGVVYFSGQQAITNYNDSRAHLNLARMVFDNQKPGLAQLGGVWLPLQHWLMLPFVWSKTLWQNGMAGTIVSMFSYIIAGGATYALGSIITRNKRIGLLAALVFLLNANVWYMQSVPMSEMLLLTFFILTAYCLTRWVISRDTWWLIATALALVGATLTRYDGWFLLLWTSVVVLVVLIHWIREKKMSLDQASALFVAFLTLAFVGVVFWLGWNLAIYGDPLFFANGPYSAEAQQKAISASGKLYTANNLDLSLKAYSWATLSNVGLVSVALLITGIIVWPGRWPRKKWLTLLPVTVLFSPFVFHVLSLYQGQSILMVPELNLADPTNPSSAWFNVRYGLMMLPAAAIWGTYFITKKSWQVLVVLLVLAQATFSIASADIITLTDATVGSSSLIVDREAKWLNEHISENDMVLASMAYHSAFAFESKTLMKQFIHEGTDELWKEALINPAPKAEWIVMMNGDIGDPLYTAFVKEDNEAFKKYYVLAYRGDFLNIYQRSDFVVRNQDTLYYKGKPFRFVGVNSYDLLYQSPDNMRKTLKLARDYGFTVVRFWAFGEGFENSMQPQAGLVDEYRITQLDILISIAREENVRLVPVLGNYWSDYGGVSHYLGWLGLPGWELPERDAFFTNQDARNLYWNYIEKIVNRQNTVTDIPYRDDATIFAWELMNEPRSADISNQEIVYAWLRDLSDYVRTLDENHMIISGVEGFMSNIYEDISGPDVIIGNSPANIDVASGHLYRKYTTDPENLDELRGVVSVWSTNSKSLNKPLIIGEVGFSREDEIDRTVWLEEVLEEAEENNISGLFIWNWAMYAGEPYTISPMVEEDRETLKDLRPLIPDTSFQQIR